MRLPTEEEAVAWAKREAQTVVDSPSDIKKHLLVLLHIIKRLERENFELRDARQRAAADTHH